MQEPINVEIDVIKRVCLWFLPYQPTDTEVLNNNNEEGKYNVNIRHSFDVENPEKGNWIMHIDIEINTIPFAKIKVRTSFMVSCTEEILFSSEALDIINKTAVEGAEKGFFEYCKTNNIEIKFLKIVNADEYVKTLRDGMLIQFKNRKNSNPELSENSKGSLHLTIGNNTLLVTQGTFIILDNVLHSNKLFNLANNQQVFHEVVPEPIYYTIKLICMELLINKKIHLNFMQTVLFQICLDAALQLMLDNHARTLQPAFIKVDFTPDKQKKFIEYGSGMLRQFRNDYKKGGAKITNLEIRYDWNSLIK